MDPDVNVEEARQVRSRLIELLEGNPANFDELVRNVERLVDLTGAIDEWMVCGGFIPKSWAAQRG